MGYQMKVIVTVIAMPAAFSRVRDSITHLFIQDPAVSVCNVHDVVGFCDVIVELNFEGRIEELFKRVIYRFNSLPEVNRIVTFPVIQNSPKQKATIKAITGYIFISTIPLMVESVQNELVKLEHIVSADIIAGEYDIFAKTIIPINKCSECASQIQMIQGIKWSRTCIPHDIFRMIDDQMKIIESSQ